MIKLEAVTLDNYKALLALKVSVDQEKYVSSIANSLASAYVYRHCAYPFAIYKDDEMVGFIMSRFNEDYGNHFIWQFMIDEKFQNKGYGKKALSEHILWIRTAFGSVDILTTVIEGNHDVEQMYMKLGFEQMGDLLDGETDFILRA